MKIGLILSLYCSVWLLGQENVAVIIKKLETYEKQGLIYLRSGNYQEAKKNYIEALKISENYLGSQHPITGNFQMRMANSYYYLGDLSSAKKFGEQALATCIHNYGDNHPTTASYLNNLALFYSDAGDFIFARQTYEKALKIKEQQFGLDSANLATIIGNIANLQKALGDFYQALIYFEREIDLRKKYMKDHPETGIALQNLASVYAEIGNYKKALELYNEAFHILDGKIPEKHPQWGAFCNNMAHLFSSMGDFPTAKEYYLQALEIGNAVDSEHINVAVMLNNIAMLMLDMGDWATAQKYLQKAIAVSEQKLGAKHPNTLMYQKNMADLHMRLGDWQQAQQLLENVYKTEKETLGKNHPLTLNAQTKLASIYLHIDNPKAAEEMMRSVITKYLQTKQYLVADYCNCLQTFVGILQANGKRDEALLYAHECLKMCEQNLGFAHLNTQSIVNQLATLYMEKGENIQATLYAQKALEYAQSQLYEIVPFLPLRQQREYLYKNFLLHLDVALSFIPEAKIYSALFAYRGFTLRSIRARYHNYSDENWQKYISVCRQYSALSLIASDTENLEELQKWQHEKDKWEESLAKEQKVSIDQKNWQDMQKELPSDAAMIDFLYYNHYTFVDGQWNSSKKIAVFIITDNLLERIEIKSTENLQQNISLIRQFLQSNISKRKYFANRSVHELYNILIVPLLPYLENKKILYIAPDGILATIPWEALPASTEKKTYLIETLKIQYIHMPHDLLPTAESKNNGLLVVSDVDYFAQPQNQVSLPNFRNSQQNWSNLPGSKQEGESIYHLYKGKNKHIISRSQASEKNIFSKAQGKSIIHLATHSFFNALEPSTPKIKIPYRLDEEYIPYWNPLIYSGIVLAGANVKDKQTKEEDGIITAEELATFPLQGTDLLVLSSCESALGYSINGQGLAGLRSASFCAGVRNLIVSLWKVSDLETAQFMETFYQKLWRKQMTPAIALHETKLDYITKGKSTQVWATFIFLGK